MAALLYFEEIGDGVEIPLDAPKSRRGHCRSTADAPGRSTLSPGIDPRRFTCASPRDGGVDAFRRSSGMRRSRIGAGVFQQVRAGPIHGELCVRSSYGKTEVYCGLSIGVDVADDFRSTVQYNGGVYQWTHRVEPCRRQFD